MSDADTQAFLRERGICTICHQNQRCCVAGALDDHDAHERYYRVMNVTGRRPWWTAAELVKIIQRAEAT